MNEESAKPEATKDQQLTRSELISAINTEIAQIEQENSRPGWSSWALQGAIATIIWLAIAEYSVQSNFRTIGIWFLFASFATDFILSVVSFFTNFHRPMPKQIRFHFTIDDPNTTAFSLLFFLCRAATLLAVYLSIQPNLHVSTMVLYCVINIVGSCIVLPIRLIKIFSAHKGLSRRSEHWITRAIILWTAYFIWQFFLRLPLEPEAIRPSDIRIALLLVGAVYLLSLLAMGGKEKPALEKLKSVRRELAFGRINMEEAAKAADIALAGFTTTGVIEHKLNELSCRLQELVSKYNGLLANCKEADERLAQLESAGTSRDGKWRESAQKVGVTIDSCETLRLLHQQSFNSTFFDTKIFLRSVDHLQKTIPRQNLSWFRIGIN